MASNRDNTPVSRGVSGKSAQGVRGGIEYRAASDSKVGDREYPRSLYVAVNASLAVFALAILMGLLLVFTPLGKLIELRGEQAQVVYTLEFHDVNGDLAATPTEGLRLFDATSGKDLGEVIGFEVLPRAIPTGQEGEPPSEAPQHDTAKTLLVTVALSCDYLSGVGYSVHGIRIAQGLNYTVLMGGSMAVGTCVSVEKGW